MFKQYRIQLVHQKPMIRCRPSFLERRPHFSFSGGTKRETASGLRDGTLLSRVRHILDVAKERFFTAHGVKEFNIGEFASGRGVSTPTLYVLFQSKTGILKAAVARSFDPQRYADAIMRRSQ
jgi:AcrR family transcriptional regulator